MSLVRRDNGGAIQRQPLQEIKYRDKWGGEEYRQIFTFGTCRPGQVRQPFRTALRSSDSPPSSRRRRRCTDHLMGKPALCYISPITSLRYRRNTRAERVPGAALTGNERRRAHIPLEAVATDRQTRARKRKTCVVTVVALGTVLR